MGFVSGELFPEIARPARGLDEFNVHELQAEQALSLTRTREQIVGQGVLFGLVSVVSQEMEG